MSIPPFPTDPTTLDLLWIALNPPEGSERTSVFDVLDMYSRLAGSDPDAVDEVIEEADPYDSGRFGFDIVVLRDPQYHEHDVLRSLITEIRRLRSDLDEAYQQMLHRPHIYNGKVICRMERKPWPCPDASDADNAAYEELHRLRREVDELKAKNAHIEATGPDHDLQSCSRYIREFSATINEQGRTLNAVKALRPTHSHRGSSWGDGDDEYVSYDALRAALNPREET